MTLSPHYFKRALGYEAVPLNALQAGHRVLALRDPDTGAQLHFAKLVVQLDKARVPTPARHRQAYWASAETAASAGTPVAKTCSGAPDLGSCSSSSSTSFGRLERTQMLSGRI